MGQVKTGAVVGVSHRSEEDGAWIAKPWDSSVGVGTGRGELMNFHIAVLV